MERDGKSLEELLAIAKNQVERAKAELPENDENREVIPLIEGVLEIIEKLAIKNKTS